MDTYRVLQPHVCCVGNPVAGNPTQFVMSRAAKVCGLDWQFFTSQVESKDFETAIRGLQALGLQGAAILDPYQSEVIPFLDTVTETAICLSKVTVARSDGNSWLGDNLQASALWQSVAPRMEPSRQEINSESDERKTLLFAGTESMLSCLNLAKPSNRWEVLPFSKEPSEQGWDAARIARERGPIHAMVLEDEFESWRKHIQSLSCVAGSPFVMIATTFEKKRSIARKTVECLGFVWVEQVEWLAHEACANFAFWTGVNPPFETVREALEEYLQW